MFSTDRLADRFAYHLDMLRLVGLWACHLELSNLTAVSLQPFGFKFHRQAASKLPVRPPSTIMPKRTIPCNGVGSGESSSRIRELQVDSVARVTGLDVGTVVGVRGSIHKRALEIETVGRTSEDHLIFTGLTET